MFTMKIKGAAIYLLLVIVTLNLVGCHGSSNINSIYKSHRFDKNVSLQNSTKAVLFIKFYRKYESIKGNTVDAPITIYLRNLDKPDYLYKIDSASVLKPILVESGRYEIDDIEWDDGINVYKPIKNQTHHKSIGTFTVSDQEVAYLGNIELTPHSIKEANINWFTLDKKNDLKSAKSIIEKNGYPDLSEKLKQINLQLRGSS